MASKASGTLFLVIEKQHASWSLMVTTSPALELRFCHRLRMPAPEYPVGQRACVYWPAMRQSYAGTITETRADGAVQHHRAVRSSTHPTSRI